MKKDIRIIGLDMDGTVLTKKKEISPRVRETIIKAIEQGVAVLPATGRTISGVPKEMMDIPGIRYILVSNGARIYDRQEQKTLYEMCMDNGLTCHIMDMLERYDVQVNVYIDGKAYMDKANLDNLEEYVSPEYIKYFSTTRELVDDLRTYVEKNNAPAEKVNVLFKNLDERAKAWKELEAEPELAITSSTENNLEINHRDANKGDALLALGKLWGVEKSQIMACGDSSNDFMMISKVGFGVVMENGIDELKEIADFITRSNEEDGVADAIEKFVLQ